MIVIIVMVSSKMCKKNLNRTHISYTHIFFCCRWLILDYYCCCFFFVIWILVSNLLCAKSYVCVCVCWFVYESWLNGGEDGSSSSRSNCNIREVGILKWLLLKTHYLELCVQSYIHSKYEECTFFINTCHIFMRTHTNNEHCNINKQESKMK